MANRYAVDISLPLKEAGLKSVLFGPSESKRRLNGDNEYLKVLNDSLTKKMNDLSKELKRTQEKLKLRSEYLTKRIDQVSKLKKEKEEQTDNITRLTIQIRSERQTSHNQLVKLQEELEAEFQAEVDKIILEKERLDFDKDVIYLRYEVFRDAYQILAMTLNDYVKESSVLANLGDEGAEIASELRTHLKEIREEQRQKDNECNQLKFVSKHFAEPKDDPPLKSKVDPTAPHPPTEAERARVYFRAIHTMMC